VTISADSPSADSHVPGQPRMGPREDAEQTAAKKRADDVYWSLRKMILRGELRPNEALVESEIAEQMEVSRTPVRQSLQRLELDGLIVSRKRRWVVYEYTCSEVADIYDVRAALEAHAVRLATIRATEEQIQDISKAWLPATSASLTGGAERVVANERFHDLLTSSAQNGRLMSLIEQSRLFNFNARIASLYTPQEFEESSDQHIRLAKAVAARDADTAARLAQSHVETALSLILKKLY
jgi:DNA-binding GntR family transcriptional regulator